MSLFLKNISASNKLLLPNGKVLKVGSELKLSESILNSSLVRKLISEGKLEVRKAEVSKSVFNELADVAATAIKVVAAVAVSPVVAIPLIPEVVSEISDVVEAIAEDKEEDTDTSKAKRRRTSVTK
jgi:hypothetical protein